MGKRSSPRGDESRGRSASRRSSAEQGGKKEQGSISLLVRNISHDCSSDLLVAFQKFGRIRDFYIPKDYYSGEPRGFAFVEFCDSRDASEAQRRMNHTMVCGREINVVPATAKRRQPDYMRKQTGVRGHSKGRHPSRHGRSRSRSHSRSPHRGGRDRSRSHSPAPRRRGDYSASPKRKEERQTKSSGQSKEHDKGKKQGPCTPRDRHDADNGSNGRRAPPDYSAAQKRTEEYQTKSPRQAKKHDEDKRQRSYTPADRNDCREARNGHNERDDYSTSPKRKEERLAKSPRLSKEHDKDKKRRSYSHDDGNDCCDADIDLKDSNVHVDRRRARTDGEGSCPRQRSPRPSSGLHSRRQGDYSASPNGEKERQEQSSSQYDKCKKQRADTPDNRNDRRDADHSHNEIQDDHPTSPKIKDERQEKSSGESNQYDKDTKRRSYAPHDRNDCRDADTGSKDNVHVDRKPVTPDVEGSHAGQRSPGPSTRSSSRRQDDYSASAKRKEELRAKSPKQPNEHVDEKKRSYTPDERNDRCDADNCKNKKQDDYSASPKRKEECRAKSPRQTKDEAKRRSYAHDDRIVCHEADNGYNERHASPDNGSPKRTEEPHQAKSQSQSNEHGNDKKPRFDTRDDRKDHCNADNGSKEPNDYYASRNKEEHGANFPRQSKEHDENKKRGSFTPDDRNDHHDTDNGSKERDDKSPSRKRMENHRAKSPRQAKEHESDKRESYTHDNRKDQCDADNGSRERDDYSASGNRKEECWEKSPRQSKEHDDHKRRGSFTLDDRNDHHDTDNGSKERDDNSAARKGMEDHHAKSLRQSKEHESDEKRGSYTRDDRKDCRDADNGSRERYDYSASRKGKEECRGKSPRRSKEHDENKKRGSNAPDDRNERRDADNGSNKHDREGSHSSSRRRSPRASSGPRSRSSDKSRALRRD